MSRTPAAHRLATKKARAQRAYVRALRRHYPIRYVTGISPDVSPEELARQMAAAPIMVIPEPRMGMQHGLTAEEWGEHLSRVGKEYAARLSRHYDTKGDS
jgi:hypothetical protein